MFVFDVVGTLDSSEQLKKRVMPLIVIPANGLSKMSMPMAYSLFAQIGSQSLMHMGIGSFAATCMFMSTLRGSF